MEITLIPVDFCNIESTPKQEGQLLYAIDTLNCVFDLSGVTRVDLGCVSILETELERESMTRDEINMDRLYICKSTNKMYRYFSIGWVLIYEYTQIQDLIVSALELHPFTLRANGQNIAPPVLAEYVFIKVLFSVLYPK